MLNRRQAIAALFGAGSLQANWPQFRGTGFRGIADDDSRLPDTWSTTENVAWKAEIPGEGWSSPVVWGDQVFLLSAVTADGQAAPKGGLYAGRFSKPIPETEYRWLLHSIDLKSGEFNWQKEMHRGVPKVSRHQKNTYASETAVTDGERVYAHIGDLGTYCYDMDGNEVWSKAGRPVRTRYGYGTASSPALHEGRIYILNDNEEQSYFAALDKLTGKEIWRVAREEPTAWTTPYIWEPAGRPEVVTVSRNKVRSYDLDGKLIWELGPLSPLAIPSPYAVDGLLYIASGYVGSEVRPIYVVKPGASGDISLAEGETSNEFITWSHPQAAAYHPTPLVYRGQLYSLLDRGFLMCFDAKTGKEIYGKQRMNREGANFTASPWAYNGRIFCLDEAGNTYVVQAGEEFKILGVNKLEEMSMASPAIADGSVLIRTFSKLYRIGG